MVATCLGYESFAVMRSARNEINVFMAAHRLWTITFWTDVLWMDSKQMESDDTFGESFKSFGSLKVSKVLDC